MEVGNEVLLLKNKKLLPILFFTMLKIGFFTFGGGYAMIALLESEFIEKKKWIDREEFLDMAAVAESTPGPIAINAATYIGYKTAGFPGAVASTVAVCIPSFLIIYIISLFFDTFLGFEIVANAFKGIQVCVLYLILSAGARMLKSMEKTPFNLVIFSVVLIAMITFSLIAVKFSTVYYILICGLLGIAFSALKRFKCKQKEGKNDLS